MYFMTTQHRFKAFVKKQITGRKSFLNKSYVFYQLLLKHEFICDPLDFQELRTESARQFHDNVCKELFTALGWKYHSRDAKVNSIARTLTYETSVQFNNL